MADSSDENKYRGEFLASRYQDRDQQPWDDLHAAAEQTSTVVRTVTSALVESHDRIGGQELTTLFRCCQNSSTISAEKKQEQIRELDLPEQTIAEIVEKITNEVGSVGGQQIALHVGEGDTATSKEEQALRDSLATLVDDDATTDERRDAVDRLTQLEYHNVQSGRMSPILHYLHPTEFPVINGRSRKGMERYFDRKISDQLIDYLDECATYRSVRDQFGFKKHYRDLDWFFNWVNREDNVWTESIREEIDRDVWQAQPGTNTHSFPEKLWPIWRERGIISIGWATSPEEDLGTQEKTIVEEMSAGDIIIAKGGHHDLLGFGVVTPRGHERLENGERIEFSNEGEDDVHLQIRHVEWIYTKDVDDAIGIDEYDLSTQFHNWTLIRYHAFNELRAKLAADPELSILDEFELLEEKSIKYARKKPKEDPNVWIEKTNVEGRAYKQEGELKLGNAVISPSRDEAGRKRYEELRGAEVGDIVLHLVQEDDEIVGISTVDSELQEDFEGPPDDRWTEQQQEEGGYLRSLRDFEKIEPPIDVYDDVLDNPEHEEALHRIREQSEKIFYNKRLSLNQGHYFTRCPDELVAVLVRESAHLRTLLEKRGYVPSVDPEPEPVGEYDSITEATENIRKRMEHTTVDRSQFYKQLSSSVIEAWTDVLANIAVQTDSVITPEEAVLVDQIRDGYRDIESWLVETAGDLGVGSLFALDPPEVLYTVLLRELQAETAGISEPNANHVKLKTILNEEYTVARPNADPDPSDHPLLDAVEMSTTDRAVHHFTAPPDYWVTALRNRAISFSGDDQDRWSNLSPGDIGLIHSRKKPGVLDIEAQPNGFIGAVVLGKRFEKEDPWWLDEIENGDVFPYLVSFDRLFVTGRFSDLTHATSVDTQDTQAIANDIEAITSNLLDFTTIDEHVREETGRGLSAQGAFSTFRTEEGALEYERPRIILNELLPHLSEIAPINLYRDIQPSLSTDLFEGLYFRGDQDERIIQEIEAALRSGKHIILTGPPGTGKTEIAERVTRSMVAAHPSCYTGSRVTTATADWSTFDTVGGYMPQETSEGNDSEELSFTPGTVLNRLRSRTPDLPANEPLVIDELNRSDIDKAFGQLFTVLSGQSVTLPYTRNGQEIEILPADVLEGEPAAHQYVIPESWRMIATMNTYDKTSLYEMSYAFMRRFAFVRIGAPSLDGLDGEGLQALVKKYVEGWEHEDLSVNLTDREQQAIGEVWKQTNATVEDRAIGPAIVRDLVLYLNNHGDPRLQSRLTRAVIAYIFPQLEGVPRRRQIVENIASVDQIDGDELRTAAREMLEVTFEDG